MFDCKSGSAESNLKNRIEERNMLGSKHDINDEVFIFDHNVSFDQDGHMIMGMSDNVIRIKTGDIYFIYNDYNSLSVNNND